MSDLKELLDEAVNSYRPTSTEEGVRRRVRRRQRTQRASAIVVAGGVFAFSVTSFGVLARIENRTPTPPHRGNEPPAVHVPDHIGSLAWTGTSLWGLGMDSRRPVDHYLLRFDPVEGTVVASLPLPGAVMLAYGAGSLWASTYEQGRLYQIDADTGRTLRAIDLGHLGQVPYLATDARSVFVFVNETLMRLDAGAAASPTRVARVQDPGGLVAAYGSIWVADAKNGTVLRLDPSTGRVLARIADAAAGEAAGIASGAGAVWAEGQSGLLKIDPATDTVVGDVAAGSPYASTENGDAVWIADTNNVWKIGRGSERAALVFEGHAVGVAVVGNRVWVADAASDLVGVRACAPTCAVGSG